MNDSKSVYGASGSNRQAELLKSCLSVLDNAYESGKKNDVATLEKTLSFLAQCDGENGAELLLSCMAHCITQAWNRKRNKKKQRKKGAASMKAISGLCAGILLWLSLSFVEINLQNKAPHPDYCPQTPCAIRLINLLAPDLSLQNFW